MNNKKLDNLIEMLCSPDDGSALRVVDNFTEVVSEKEQLEYPIENGVLNLLPKKLAVANSKSDVHQNTGNTFDYIDHYKKDADYFDYFEEYKDGATWHENRRLHEAILSEIPKSISNILDVGCGNGWIAKAMQHRDVEVYSFDIAMKNVQTALNKYPFGKHYGLVGDLFSLPIKPQCLDCIVCAEVIEHVHDPALLIQNLLRCLKPRGTLILTTPHNEKIVYHMCVHCNHPTPENAHLHSFTKAKLATLASKDSSIIDNLQIYTFSNKYLSRLRTHILLKYLPYSLWKWIDRIANAVINRPVRLLLKVKKK